MEPQTHAVPSPSGSLEVHEWVGMADTASFLVVTVHPWATLGGGEHNTAGLAEALACTSGARAFTFQMRSGSGLWGLLSAHRAEVSQVRAVCNWACARFPEEPLVLLGSSAGGPIAGSALERLPSAAAFVAIGYTWGNFAALGFGRHFGPLRRASVPKLFMQGELDEFTAPATLERSAARCSGGTNDVLVIAGVGHFELEQPGYDKEVTRAVLEWLQLQDLHAPRGTSPPAAHVPE